MPILDILSQTAYFSKAFSKINLSLDYKYSLDIDSAINRGSENS